MPWILQEVGQAIVQLALVVGVVVLLSEAATRGLDLVARLRGRSQR